MIIPLQILIEIWTHSSLTHFNGLIPMLVACDWLIEQSAPCIVFFDRRNFWFISTTCMHTKNRCKYCGCDTICSDFKSCIFPSTLFVMHNHKMFIFSGVSSRPRLQTKVSSSNNLGACNLCCLESQGFYTIHHLLQINSTWGSRLCRMSSES